MNCLHRADTLEKALMAKLGMLFMRIIESNRIWPSDNEELSTHCTRNKHTQTNNTHTHTHTH